ncbi:hypothetical protein VP01_2381g1 [Puccinia sorghi]|uniref:Uncharacterized protein n=1 Tax=Puccinia sorghi TaxID=27349 RepID=A0A0L6V730_9BASI|nr:hypothetical protein VP01_2381g1 [Puccinia sorghi]
MTGLPYVLVPTYHKVMCRNSVVAGSQFSSISITQSHGVWCVIGPSLRNASLRNILEQFGGCIKKCHLDISAPNQVDLIYPAAASESGTPCQNMNHSSLFWRGTVIWYGFLLHVIFIIISVFFLYCFSSGFFSGSLVNKSKIPFIGNHVFSTIGTRTVKKKISGVAISLFVKPHLGSFLDNVLTSTKKVEAFFYLQEQIQHIHDFIIDGVEEMFSKTFKILCRRRGYLLSWFIHQSSCGLGSQSFGGSLMVKNHFFSFIFSFFWLFLLASAEHISSDGGRFALETFPVAYVPFVEISPWICRDTCIAGHLVHSKSGLKRTFLILYIRNNTTKAISQIPRSMRSFLIPIFYTRFFEVLKYRLLIKSMDHFEFVMRLNEFISPLSGAVYKNFFNDSMQNSSAYFTCSVILILWDHSWHFLGSAINHVFSETFQKLSGRLKLKETENSLIQNFEIMNETRFYDFQIQKIWEMGISIKKFNKKKLLSKFLCIMTKSTIKTSQLEFSTKFYFWGF